MQSVCFPPTTWQKVPESVQPRNTSPERLAHLGLQFLPEHLTFTTPVASFSKHFHGKLIFQQIPEWVHWWDTPGWSKRRYFVNVGHHSFSPINIVLNVSLVGRLQRQIKVKPLKPVKSIKTLRGGSLPDCACVCVCVRLSESFQEEDDKSIYCCQHEAFRWCTKQRSRSPADSVDTGQFQQGDITEKAPNRPAATSQTPSSPPEPLGDLTSSF